MQAEAAGGVTAFIASTMPEVWQLVESGMVQEGLIKDVSGELWGGADGRSSTRCPLARTAWPTSTRRSKSAERPP